MNPRKRTKLFILKKRRDGLPQDKPMSSETQRLQENLSSEQGMEFEIVSGEELEDGVEVDLIVGEEPTKQENKNK